MSDHQKENNEFKEVQISEHPEAAGLYTPVAPQAANPPINYYAQPAFNQGSPGIYNDPNQYVVNVPPGPPNAYQQNVYLPNNYPPVVYAPQGNPQIMIVAPNVFNAEMIQLDGESDIVLVKYSRWARYVSIANFILDFLIMIGVPFLFFTIAFNLLGYFGARRFHKCLSVGFLVYLGIIILIKLIILGIMPYPYLIVIYAILILFGIAFGVIFLLFTIKLFKASHGQAERLSKYHTQQGNSGCCCFFI